MPKWLNPLKTLTTERRTSARERYPAQVLAAERRSSGPIRGRSVASAPAAPRKHTRWSDGGQEQVSVLHPYHSTQLPFPFDYSVIATPQASNPDRPPGKPSPRFSSSSPSTTSEPSLSQPVVPARSRHEGPLKHGSQTSTTGSSTTPHRQPGASSSTHEKGYHPYRTPKLWPRRPESLYPRLPPIPLTPRQKAAGEIPILRPFAIRPPPCFSRLNQQRTPPSTKIVTPPSKHLPNVVSSVAKGNAMSSSPVKPVKVLKRSRDDPFVPPEPKITTPIAVQQSSSRFPRKTVYTSGQMIEDSPAKRRNLGLTTPLLSRARPRTSDSDSSDSEWEQDSRPHPTSSPTLPSRTCPLTKPQRPLAPLPTSPDPVLPRQTPAQILKKASKSLQATPPAHSPQPKPSKLLARLRSRLKASDVEIPPGFDSPEHHRILDAILNRRSVLITGSAGTGKTYTIKAIIDILKKTPRKGDNRPPRVAITATTGQAALAIGGVTLHSWAGVGLLNQPKEVTLQQLLLVETDAQGKFVRNGLSPTLDHWQKTDILIIDEVSMLSAEQFDTFAYFAQKIRKTSRPFGGIQIILVGDPLQLPPVSTSDGPRLPFFFEASGFDACVKLVVELQQVHRQSNPSFINMLTEMRVGRLSHKSLTLLRSAGHSPKSADCSELFATNWLVNGANSRRLSKFTGKAQTYDASDFAYLDVRGEPIEQPQAFECLKQLNINARLSLKIGCRVMLISNASSKLVNGSIGTVIAFAQPKFNSQYRTLHQPRGTNDAFNIKADQLIVPRMCTEKEARKRRRDWVAEQQKKMKADPKIYKGYSLAEGSLPEISPIVQFDNGEKYLIPTYRFQKETWSWILRKLVTNVSRQQLPLKLAYAMTIHKSQGQSLDAVKVDFSNVQQDGQAYTAVSRCRTIEGLQILHFHPSHIKANQKVLRWLAEKTDSPIYDEWRTKRR